MTREARANLIFLIILLILISPGFAILIHRKLTGSPRPNDLPEPPPTAVAYMQPPPVPPALPRREPALVRDWVRQLLQARLGPGVRVIRASADTNAGPLVSDRFVTQLVGLNATADGSLQAALLRWDASTVLSMTDPIVTARVGDRELTAKTLRVEAIDVPKDVRHAIQDVGYVDPPATIWWIETSIPTQAGDASPTSITLRRDSTHDVPQTETITLAPIPRPAGDAP